MKKLSILGLFILAIVGFNSCETEDDVVFVAQEAGDLAFTNSFSSVYILTPVASDNLGERFTWSDADFDVPTNVTYELQSSITGDFSDASVVGSTTDNEIAVTIGEMLALANEAGLDNDPDTEDIPNTGTVFFRLKAFVGDAGLDTFSTPSALNVELPEGESTAPPELPKLYVVGSFLAASGYGADWTPADAVPIAASAVGNNDYEGFVFMDQADPEFKFLPTNESFDGDYGDDGTFSGTLIQEGEQNCTISGPGYFLVRANLDDLTYSTQATSWGVIGNATPTGWDSDTDMVYDADTQTWSLTLDLIPQESPDNGLKFRANDDWGLNLGDNDADGSMEFDGQNIGIETAGTYLITLDLSDPRAYSYSIELQ